MPSLGCCRQDRAVVETNTPDMSAEPKITLRVSGLGNKLTLSDLPASTTVAELRQKVFEQTGVPPRFQKFLGPQKLNIVYREEDDVAEKSLADLNIQDRTRLMLLHAPNYQMEKDVYEQLQNVQDEINALESSIKNMEKSTKNPKYVPEMVTRICCKLDAIDVSVSKDLRAQRKSLIQKAEELETTSANHTEC